MTYFINKLINKKNINIINNNPNIYFSFVVSFPFIVRLLKDISLFRHWQEIIQLKRNKNSWSLRLDYLEIKLNILSKEQPKNQK